MSPSLHRGWSTTGAHTPADEAQLRRSGTAHTLTLMLEVVAQLHKQPAPDKFVVGLDKIAVHGHRRGKPRWLER